MLAQVVPHALDRASDGKGAAAGQGVAGVGGKVAHLARGHVQPGGTRLQRPEHDAVTGQDDAAQKASIGVDGLDRHGRPDHHHHTGAGPALAQQALTCADHGHPAIRAQAGRVVVAVAQPGLGAAGDHPLRRDVPDLQLLLDASLDRIAGDDAAQHPTGGGQLAPVAFAQLLDVLQKLGAMGQQPSADPGFVVQRPFQAGVAHIDCQKAHTRHYPHARAGIFRNAARSRSTIR